MRSLARDFSTLTPAQESYLKSDKIVDEFAQALKDVIPDSCFVQTHFAIPFPKPHKPKCPPSPIETAKSLSFQNPPGDHDKELLRAHLTLTDEERATIEQVTLKQHNCDEWNDQRKGRITASTIKRVFTRTNTLIKDPSADPTAVVTDVMGEKPTRMTGDMKHGLSNEPHAKKNYAQEMRKRHKKFRTHECGMVVHKEYSFLSASPDLRVSCECHGQGLCEVKCPPSVGKAKPTAKTYSQHLVLENGRSTLSTTSPHYYQIQMQMVITDTNYCDYYVFGGPKATFLERIELDEDFCEHVITTVHHFYSKYIIPRLMQISLESKDDKDPTALADEHQYATDMPSQEDLQHPNGTQSVPLKAAGSNKNPLTKPIFQPVYLCGICGTDVADEPETFEQQSVECSSCNRWIHFYCANLTKDDVKGLSEVWLCFGCVPKPSK